ncbi:MAG TPA: 7,8-didemethyl-8-hydroxy-5-deazariboflavin synthase subunit CofG [Desulfobacteria bacterium]|nr:7,8-didemethyl-8-hydroxy-5-deazariboflavin synthase subunit CofG [Desulfobacteria bacterium]
MTRKYVTFSKNVFIPVTNVCRNACDYCVFRARSRDDAYVTTVSDFLTVVRNKGAATEALCSGGENPEAAALSSFFNDHVTKEGFSSLVAYTKHLCKLAIQHGLLPHCNLGVLSREELLELKDVNASMGLMLETTAELEAHKNSPGKDPAVRLEMIAEAGRLKIPFTTGILIGIGEGNEDRIRSLEAIASVHKQYGHIQEVIIQPFLPKQTTAMWHQKQPRFEELKETVRAAHVILPAEIAIQVPPNLTSPKELIELGASDLGGISERTIDYINPESPWPREEELRRKIAPYELRERLPIYPQFIKQGWYSDELRPLIERYADEEGLRLKEGK